uniref:Uncharacterized protein n=1 Tax=Pararge aegeria TaxID=116150 RepID=S4NMY0_9NEOP
MSTAHEFYSLVRTLYGNCKRCDAVAVSLSSGRLLIAKEPTRINSYLTIFKVVKIFIPVISIFILYIFLSCEQLVGSGSIFI